MIELRCSGCNKKLAEELEGKVKIVCSRCKKVNILRSKEHLCFEQLASLKLKESDQPEHSRVIGPYIDK